MSTDFDAIGQALANLYVPAAVTPPTGLQNVRGAHVDLPNTLTRFPIVLVFPDAGELSGGQGSRLSTADWFVRFYLSRQLNLPRETNQCRKWLGVLIDQLAPGARLSGTPVQVARVLRWKIGTLDYAKRAHTGIELQVRCTLFEGWSA